MELPDIETVSAAVHAAWMEGKVRNGIMSRKSETGEELMASYERLSETAKDADRNTVKAVYAAIRSAPTMNNHKEFAKALESVINGFSQENGSDTPDFILAQYLLGCLSAWNDAVKARERWYGREAEALIASGGSGVNPVDPQTV